MNNWLPGLPIPRLMHEVEIAIYMVHNSRDPEDYFFLFDFEEFVARSESGLFVHPALRIFAGRDDFGRTQFARQFREVFAAEFDRMRSELTSGKGKRGWLDKNWAAVAAVDLFAGAVAVVVLAVALSLGGSIFSSSKRPRLRKMGKAEAKLAEDFEQTRSKVEAALSRIDVTIHPELFDHAWRDGRMGRFSGMDRDAWPLPAYVRNHLDRGQSTAWW